MILKFYKSSLSLGIFLIPLLAITFCLPLFFNTISDQSYGFEWQKELFDSVHNTVILNFIVTIIILILNSTLIVQSFNKSNFFSKTTYLPAFVYLFFVSYSDTILFSPQLIIHFLLILLFNQILKINPNESSINIAFKSGLLIGIIACFNLYYIVLLLIVIITLLLIKSFNLRAFILVFLGGSLPLLYLFSTQFIFSNTSFDFGALQLVNHPIKETQLIDYIKLISISLIVLLSFTTMKKYNKYASLQIKKQNLTLIISSFFMVIIFCYVLYKYNYFDYIFIIPLVYMASSGFFNLKNDSFISLLLTILLIVNIVSLFIT